MTAAVPIELIEPFVRESLGCGCPDSVFETLESGVCLNGGIRYQRLLAGDRLLVYLLQAEPDEELVDRVLQLLGRGREERDRSGYNRFRLVLLGSLPEQQALAIRRAFERCVGEDDRLHLHHLPQDELQNYWPD